MQQNQDKYLWTKHLMPMVYELGNKLKKSNQTILISLPLTWETLCLIDAIRTKIKPIVIPLTSGKSCSLQSGVFKYLDKWKITYYKEATSSNRTLALKHNPDIVLDCVFTISNFGLSKRLINPSTLLIEDTRTGSLKLQESLQKYKFTNPFIALDDYDYKRKYENRIGIGYSIVSSLASNGILLKGKEVVIVGFGPIGQGLAEFCAGMGAKVNIVEIDKERKKIARKKYIVGQTEQFLKSDIFITATGMQNVITKRDLKSMKNGAMLVNAGADFGEWDQKFLHQHRKKIYTNNIISYTLPNEKQLFELGGGNSFNLVSGVSISTFLDITFSLAIQSIRQFNSETNERTGELKMKSFYLKELDRKINKFT